MRTVAIALAGIGLLMGNTVASAAEEMQEIVVTGSRLDEGASVPGTFLQRVGDFVLLQVAVANDTRERDARRNEIYETLRAALAAAKREGSIELSVVDDNGMVLPLRVDSATLVLSAGDRPDTSRTTINVKTRIPGSGANGQALISKLKDFVTAIKPVGRTQLVPDGDVEISVVNPHQYREKVIELFAQDVGKVTAALGPDYKVVVSGVDRPIRWVRAGLLELAIYIPYSYHVVPGSMTSFTVQTRGD